MKNKNQPDNYRYPHTQSDFLRLQKWYFSWLRYIGQKVNLKPYLAKEVIDFGGGIGAFCSLLLTAGFRDVTCNDISNEALRLARKFNPKLKTSHFDIEKIKVKNKYDLIFAFEVLEHFGNPQRTIKLLFNLLKRGGIFIGSTPYPFPKGFQDATHLHVLLPEKWKSFFEKAGFKQVSIFPMSFPPLLYRFNKHLNFRLPWYIRNKYFVSTTLIIAKKDG